MGGKRLPRRVNLFEHLTGCTEMRKRRGHRDETGRKLTLRGKHRGICRVPQRTERVASPMLLLWANRQRHVYDTLEWRLCARGVVEQREALLPLYVVRTRS